jgi:hypothetical protein
MATVGMHQDNHISAAFQGCFIQRYLSATVTTIHRVVENSKAWHGGQNSQGVVLARIVNHDDLINGVGRDPLDHTRDHSGSVVRGHDKNDSHESA